MRIQIHIHTGYDPNTVPIGFKKANHCKGFFIVFFGYVLHIGVDKYD